MQGFLQYLSQCCLSLICLEVPFTTNGIFFGTVSFKINEFDGETFGCGDILTVLMFFYSSL